MSTKSNKTAQTAVIETPVVKTTTTPGLTGTYDFQELAKEHTTKSSMIRFLASKGEKMGPISRALSAHYGKVMKFQHVRNVLTKTKKD